jgi:hypothetical protein
MTSPADTPLPVPPAPFFQAGYTYRHAPGTHGNERFLCEYIAIAPPEFQSPLERSPVAWGWINAIKTNSDEIHFGAFHLDDFTTWEVDPDVDPKPLSGETITAQNANHVLWHFNQGGLRPGSFTTALLNLLARADPLNAARLARSFPALRRAMFMAQDTRTGIAELKRIAASEAPPKTTVIQQ